MGTKFLSNACVVTNSKCQFTYAVFPGLNGDIEPGDSQQLSDLTRLQMNDHG